MIVVSHDQLPWEEWRPGVRSRAWATAATGARQVRIAEQTFDSGCQAPLHWHYFEENITIVEGVAEMRVDDETVELGPGNTVVIPATVTHGFRNAGTERLHIIASMGWPINEINYVSAEDAEVWRSGEIVGGGARRRLEAAAAPVGR